MIILKHVSVISNNHECSIDILFLKIIAFESIEKLGINKCDSAEQINKIHILTFNFIF